MTLKINDIPPEGLQLELDLTLNLFDQNTASTACSAKLDIKPTGEGFFHIIGRIQAEPMLECSRCLKNFPYRIDTEINVDLAPLQTQGTASEYELGKSELDIEFYQGEEIDPTAFVKEQLLISLPMIPLHHQDCRGLCMVCGNDLNESDCGCTANVQKEFGAFSQLKDLFKKQKE